MNPPPDSGPAYYRRRNVVIAVIAAIAIVAAIARVALTPAPPVAGTVSTAAARSPAPAEAAAPAGAASAADSIDVGVTYVGVVAALPASAKVFVFVRPVGERIPLGAHSYAARELPLSLAFSRPTDGLDRAVEVVARLSLSGAVALQPGDVEAVSGPLRFGASPQRIALALAAIDAAAPASPAAAAAPNGAQAAGGVRVPVRVELGAGVALPPDTAVYVIARANDGNPMPLAVKRLRAADLPADVVLSDADAMTLGRSLAGATRIELVARATRSGDVKASAGDYEARSGALDVAAIAQPVVLVLDRPL